MNATSSLLFCVLAAAQPAERLEWQLQPRLGSGQELVYHGTFDEQNTGGEVQFTRTYRVHAVAFVLDATPRGADLAFLTVLRSRTARAGRAEDALPSSVRLEVLKVDPQGRLVAEAGGGHAVPLEGPPALETGMFLEGPRHRVGVGGNWAVMETGRPSLTWTIAGTEAVGVTTCLKVVGVQKSDDWDKPRADRTAWRRQDTIWLAPRLGIAYRIERVIERRAPAHRDAGYRSVLRCELDGRTEHVGSIGDDIRREVAEVRKFGERAAPYLREPVRYRSEIDALLGRIRYHQERTPSPPPYAEALRHLQRRLEAARRGDAPPVLAQGEPEATPQAIPGRPAPDFVVPDFTSENSARLARWKGKPILLVFFSPTSAYAESVLRLGQDVHDGSRGAVVVLGMALTQDATAVRHVHRQLRLSYPILDASGLRQSYLIEATPKLMVIDEEGVVRGAHLGWGRETRGTVLSDLQSSLPRPKP